MNEVRYFWTAVMLLTRLPVPRLKGFQDDWLARSAVYFPIVGLLVGLLAAAVHWGATSSGPSPCRPCSPGRRGPGDGRPP